MEEVAEKKCNDAFDYIQRNTGPVSFKIINPNFYKRFILDSDGLNLKREKNSKMILVF